MSERETFTFTVAEDAILNRRLRVFEEEPFRSLVDSSAMRTCPL